MGLNKEVREFFNSKINAVLDKKLEEIKETVDRERVKQICLKKLCDKAGIKMELLDELQTLQDEITKLNSRQSDVQSEIRSKLREINVTFDFYGYSNINYNAVRAQAVNRLENDVLVEYYPDVGPQVEKIQCIKDDVYGSILLATTERKLVSTLTKLLTNYGGDISELLELIPEQE